jgi:hypothetical protein
MIGASSYYDLRRRLTLLCDIADQEGVPVPELSPETQQVMIQSLDKPTLLGNPLDVEDMQRIKPEGFDHCLEKFFQEPTIDMVGLRLNLPESLTPSSRSFIKDFRLESRQR